MGSPFLCVSGCTPTGVYGCKNWSRIACTLISCAQNRSLPAQGSYTLTAARIDPTPCISGQLVDAGDLSFQLFLPKGRGLNFANTHSNMPHRGVSPDQQALIFIGKQVIGQRIARLLFDPRSLISGEPPTSNFTSWAPEMLVDMLVNGYLQIFIGYNNTQGQPHRSSDNQTGGGISLFSTFCLLGTFTWQWANCSAAMNTPQNLVNKKHDKTKKQQRKPKKCKEGLSGLTEENVNVSRYEQTYWVHIEKHESAAELASAYESSDSVLCVFLASQVDSRIRELDESYHNWSLCQIKAKRSRCLGRVTAWTMWTFQTQEPKYRLARVFWFVARPLQRVLQHKAQMCNCEHLNSDWTRVFFQNHSDSSAFQKCVPKCNWRVRLCTRSKKVSRWLLFWDVTQPFMFAMQSLRAL